LRAEVRDDFFGRIDHLVVGVDSEAREQSPDLATQAAQQQRIDQLALRQTNVELLSRAHRKRQCARHLIALRACVGRVVGVQHLPPLGLAAAVEGLS
jgi:hypothetical protein